jgi:hypothetical protein
MERDSLADAGAACGGGEDLLCGGVRIPLIVIAESGMVITDSGDGDHSVGAKRR